MKTPLPEPAGYLFNLDTALYDTPAFIESQLKAAMVAAWNEAIEESVTAMWHSYTEGPEAMEVLMDKLKKTP